MKSDNWLAIGVKINLNYLSPYSKINPRWIKDDHVKKLNPKTTMRKYRYFCNPAKDHC